MQGKELIANMIRDKGIGAKSLYSDVRNLYRHSLKSIPNVITVYDLDMTARELHDSVRSMFEKNRDVSDPRVVAWLYRKGEMELAETVEIWKQKTHLLRLLGHDESHHVSVRIPGKYKGAQLEQALSRPMKSVPEFLESQKKSV